MMPRLATALLALIGTVLASCSESPQTTSPPAQSSPPPAAAVPRISYDNQCYMIDGKDAFFYSGSFHYFRCPKALWADRFQKMKDAGLNCVETYAAWNWHEQQPPANLDDFSKMDMTDLTDWLDMAINRFGFYVILRPGPYICAEWDGGGYPQWLVTKKPAGAPRNWLRSDDPAYLAWCKHWYTAVAKATVPFQITRMPAGKPGVILWQIENEYDYANFPAEVKLHQLQALAHDSRDLGIDVPLITCVTNDPLFRQDPYLLQNVVECRNAYPKYDPYNELHAIMLLESYQPDKPRMMTELQGGWFSEKGHELSEDMGYTAQQITHVTLLAWAHGFTGTNYYMMFGGTNLGDWGSANKTTTYDYAAPLREWGGVGPRYFAVQAMANVVKQYGAQLARSVYADVITDPKPQDMTVILRRAQDGSRFLFVLNDSKSDRATGKFNLVGEVSGDLQYDLDPFDAKILYLPPNETDPAKGTWLPVLVAPPQRPTNLPAAVNITEARMQVDPGPSDDSWRDLPDGAGVEDMGIFDRRYVFYRSAPFSLQSGQSAVLSALLPGQDDFLAQLNGARLDTGRHGRGTVAAVFSTTNADSNQIEVLYENGGRDNGGDGMNDKCGLKNPIVGQGIILPETLPHWVSRQEQSDPAPNVAADLDDSTWEKANIDSRPNQVAPQTTTVFRTHFDLTSDDLKPGGRMLIFSRFVGEHEVYCNGQPITALGDSSQFDLSPLLKPGRNSIAVVVTAQMKNAGISGGAELDPVQQPDPLPIHWQISGDSAGSAGKWFDPALDDSKWDTVKIAGDPSDPTAKAPINLTWYRLQFNLPTPDEHVWVPWKLHLQAAGNGFIYLNGHFLGRWWEVGPQQDFFLPECWLNFGDGKTNNVTLCLRPTHGQTSVQNASVSPYNDFAETR